MAKLLKKRVKRGQKSIQLYGGDICGVACNRCASVPANDYNNVHDVVSI